MRPETCFLPNGRTFTVTPVFGGVSFKFNDLRLSHDTALHPGWSVGISTHKPSNKDDNDVNCQILPFTKPTLGRDDFYISAIFSTSNVDYKPPISPTREIAKMVWVTLWWYFHQPEPGKGDWRVYIKRDGIFNGQNLLQKLERMGLIASEDSIVGESPIEMRDLSAWSKMFVSRRSFWQIDPRIFLIIPVPTGLSLASTSTPLSQASPSNGDNMRWIKAVGLEIEEETFSTAAGGPFISRSHIPTYYPPPPTQYMYSNGTQHPVRPKPPHQGEVFYVRYIPSVQQYLSFRVAFLPFSISRTPNYNPTGTLSISAIRQNFQKMPSDLDMLRKWMDGPWSNPGWTELRPLPDQNKQEPLLMSRQASEEVFLRSHFQIRHSFPAVGCWNGNPFGYFQVYWVKESRLGQTCDEVDNYDRGVHCLYSDPESVTPLRMAIWLSALVHYCWLADIRTQSVVLELKMENER